MRRPLLLLATVSPLFGLACQTIIGADFGEAKLAPAEVVCVPHGPPKRPASLPKATDTVDFTVVINQLDFGDENLDAGVLPPVGYDLDNVCTGADGPRSCKPYPWLVSNVVDGPGGRDDGVGVLFRAQRDVFGAALIGSKEENEGIGAGVTAPPGVVRVRGFSGLTSDDHVVVELFQAGALDAGDHPAGVDAGAHRPTFTVSDRWPLVSTSLTNTDPAALESSQRDEQAFVLDGVLVAHFDELHLPMHNIYIDVSEAVLTGRLYYSPGIGWTLQDGTLAARIQTDFLLGFVPLATRSVVNVSLCTNDMANYNVVKRILCESADLPERNGDPKSACAYTSLGLGFQSSPAALGPVIDVDPPVTPCAPDVDPAHDHCSIPE